MRFKKRTTFKNCVAGILQHQHQRHLRKTSLQNLQADDCATVHIELCATVHIELCATVHIELCATVHIAYCGEHWEQASLDCSRMIRI